MRWHVYHLQHHRWCTIDIAVVVCVHVSAIIRCGVCVNANADDVCERVRMRLVRCDDDESMVKI